MEGKIVGSSLIDSADDDNNGANSRQLYAPLYDEYLREKQDETPADTECDWIAVSMSIYA